MKKGQISEKAEMRRHDRWEKIKSIAAAGGTVEAPYLKADLRVTIVSGLLAMAAGPAGFILLIVTAIIT